MITMFAKFPLILVFIAFVSLGKAYPNADHHESSSEEHHHKGDKHNHGKGHKHDHQHHGGEGPYGGNVDLKINPDSPFMKIKNLTEDLYNEIFVIASGDNYASPELSNDVHISARAVVLSSQKLHAMKKVYPLIFNLTGEYALKGVTLEDKQTMVDLINDLIAQMKNKFPDVEVLRNAQTDTFITRGKFFKSGATPQEKTQAYEKWLWDPFVGTAAMNKLFYRAVLKNDKPEYKILEAMVKNAEDHDPTQEKLEKIYAHVVAKTVEKVCPTHEPRKAALIFYKNLMEQLAEDATLLLSLYNGSDMSMMIEKPF